MGVGLCGIIWIRTDGEKGMEEIGEIKGVGEIRECDASFLITNNANQE